MSQLRSYLSIFCLCLSTCLQAETLEPASDAPAQISVDFTFYLAGSQALGSEAAARSSQLRKPREYFIFNQGQAQSVELIPGRETRTIRYIGPAEFSLYRMNGRYENGQPVYEPILEIKLPLTWKSGMLALFGKGDNYRLFPMETSASPERSNTAQFYNISNTPIVCKAGNTKLNLAPYASGSVSLNEIQSDLQLEIQCAALASDTDWRLVYSGSQTVKKGRFYIFLLTPDASGENYRILRFKAG